MINDPYYNLGAAVVIQAVNDYITAWDIKNYPRNYTTNERLWAERVIPEVEKFFNSNYIVDDIFEKMKPAEYIKTLREALEAGEVVKKIYSI